MFSHEHRAQIAALYELNLPRYTSYPTALEFENHHHSSALQQALAKNESPLSLYVHIPFCHSMCYYCGCNKVITQHAEKADKYLQYVFNEISTMTHHARPYSVSHLHLGGGSPSFLSIAQHKRLVEQLQLRFKWQQNIKMSIELDPRTCSTHYIDALVKLGYKRISFGIQDTDKQVQDAINRTQENEHIAALFLAARKAGATSLNCDLIVGLPRQTLSTIKQTLHDVMTWEPDRLSVFNYAHLPQKFAAQRKFDRFKLPDVSTKKAMSQFITGVLIHRGYDQIGLDHFAKHGDPLAIAMRQKTLKRNFQGYTADDNANILGFGVSAISSIDNIIAQNPTQLNQYQQVNLIESLHTKGRILSKDDLIRRDIISEIMCNQQLNITQLETQMNASFCEVFADEAIRLTALNELNVINWQNKTDTQDEVITIEAAHKPLSRVVANVFDQYTRCTNSFSKVG